MSASDRFIQKVFGHVSHDADPWLNSQKLIEEARNSTKADFLRKLPLVSQANIYQARNDYESLHSAATLYREFFRLEDIKSYKKSAQELLKTGAICTYMKLCLQEEILESKLGLVIEIDELLKDKDVRDFVKGAEAQTGERYSHYQDLLKNYRADKRLHMGAFHAIGYGEEVLEVAFT